MINVKLDVVMFYSNRFTQPPTHVILGMEVYMVRQQIVIHQSHDNVVPKVKATVPAVAPVYTEKALQYPDSASQRHQSFMPHFAGFSGMYCFQPSLPSNLTIASSMEMSLPGRKHAPNLG